MRSTRRSTVQLPAELLEVMQAPRRDAGKNASAARTNKECTRTTRTTPSDLMLNRSLRFVPPARKGLPRNFDSLRRILHVGFGAVGAGCGFSVPIAVLVFVLDHLGAAGDCLLPRSALRGSQRGCM